MSAITATPAYRRYLASNFIELQLDDLTPDENGKYHLHIGERFCRVAGCKMALCDASSLRRHIMRRHKAVYDALDACKPATVVITDERRHRAIAWYNKIMDDYDRRQASLEHPLSDTDDDSPLTDLDGSISLQTGQSSASVTPIKRRFSSSENESQIPLTDLRGTGGNTPSVSANSSISVLIHTGIQGRSREQQRNPSSAMPLIAGVSELHNPSVPNTSMTDASPGGQAQAGEMPPPNRVRATQSPSAELISILPSHKATRLLVTTYFDRAHWLMPIFDEKDFYMKWDIEDHEKELQLLYGEEISIDPTTADFTLGFMSTLLMAVVFGLQYVGPHRRQLLAEEKVDTVTLTDIILTTVQGRMMDIVSLGSLEAAQTCILLSTYYLHHGDPALAWPICGCGLRIAQALKLHRDIVTPSSMPSALLERKKAQERCWCAIYEIETFCSMSYGYPQAIRDGDCNLGLVVIIGSLLEYRWLMYELSAIIKDIQNQMYGVNNLSYRPCSEYSCASIQHHLSHMAWDFDTRLQAWKGDIPPRLRLDLDNPDLTIEELDRDIEARFDENFENHIYQIQALALEIAYQNAKILIHRPLMAYEQTLKVSTEPNQHHLRGSLYQLCRDAALKISEIVLAPIFSLAADTYAGTLIGVQTFNASVTLCILASIEPLTVEAHESKMGLHRLLSMQRTLAPKSQLVAQELAILEQLTKLVMEMELKKMLAQNDNQEFFFTAGEGGREPISVESLGDIANLEFREDPKMSQALSDFHRAIYGHMSPAADLQRRLFPERQRRTNGFAQQRAWIWDPALFSGSAGEEFGA